MAAKLIAKRQARINIVSELLMSGTSSPTAIRQQLIDRGMECPSRFMIQQDISYIMSEWRERRTMMIDQRVSLELSLLESIRTKALKAYENSTGGITTTEEIRDHQPVAQIGIAGPPPPPLPGQEPTALQRGIQQMLNGDGNLRTSKQVTKRKEVSSSGDPRFLDVAIGASKEIRTLLGVDPIAVKKIELITRNEGAISIDKLREMGAAELARIVNDEIANATNA